MPVATVEMINRFQALLQLESNTYQFKNYLLSTNNTPMHMHRGSKEAVLCHSKRQWRTKVCGWMYQVVDGHNLDRELVCIAMNYMDRFLSQHSFQDYARVFQLVGMTSLYMAIKIFRNQGKCAAVSSFSKLSNGLFNDDDFLQMETRMLHTLQWRMHPPTPQSYLELLIVFLPRNSCFPYTRRDLVQRITFLLELSVTVQFFFRKKPSNIALAAFIEVMNHEQAPNVPKQSIRDHFRYCVRSIAGINYRSKEVVECLNAFKVVHKNAIDQMDIDSKVASGRKRVVSGRKLSVVTP